MDGGRVLRAALAHRLGFARATQIAANVGQAFAFIFALLGFFFNPLLLFIALFVYLGASGEVPMAQLREFARGIPVGSVMLTRFKAFRADSPLSEAVDALLSGSDREFPVIGEDGRVEGILCREDIIRALSNGGVDTPVSDAMQATVPTSLYSEMLETAFQRMNSGGYPSIPVVDRDHNLVGLLSRENIAEMMMIQNALPAGSPSGLRHRPPFCARNVPASMPLFQHLFKGGVIPLEQKLLGVIARLSVPPAKVQVPFDEIGVVLSALAHLLQEFVQLLLDPLFFSRLRAKRPLKRPVAHRCSPLREALKTRLAMNLGSYREPVLARPYMGSPT